MIKGQLKLFEIPPSNRGGVKCPGCKGLLSEEGHKGWITVLCQICGWTPRST